MKTVRALSMKKVLLLSLGLSAAAIVGCDSSSSSGTPGATNPVDGGVASKCVAPTGAPVVHNAQITADETWAATSPHVIRGSVGIGKGAKVTIEPCAQVRMAADAVLIVSGPTTPQTASLVAEADAEHPISFSAEDASKPWGNVEVREGGSMSLAYVTLEGGGSGNGPFSDAILRIFGDQYKPPQALVKAQHVTIKNSANYGVFLGNHGTFTADSADLTVTGSKTYPIATWASSLDNLPNGSFTGNGTDEVVIRGGGGYEAVTTSLTMKNLGVPYHVGTAQTSAPVIVVSAGPSGGPLVTLTIEAGTHLEFAAGGSLQVEPATNDFPATGALVAVGTEADPIVFTSASKTKAPGDWVGLWFGLLPAAQNHLDHVHVDYAGGTTGTQSFSCNDPQRDEAAVLILGEPQGVFITNSKITNSKRHGIDRGWRGAALDFMGSSSFDAVAGCKQTYPKDDNGACPPSPPCP